MRRFTYAWVAVLAATALAGCTAAPPDRAETPGHSLSPIPTRSAEPAPGEKPLVIGATGDIGVRAFDLGTYISTADSGFADPATGEDAFPRGSRVAVFRVAIDGFVPFGQPDITDLTVSGTHWDGHTELAVLDAAEGPSFAGQAGIPWGIEDALGSSKPWLLENYKLVNFAVAYFVPDGASILNLVIDPPTQPGPLTLRVPFQGE